MALKNYILVGTVCLAIGTLYQSSKVDTRLNALENVVVGIHTDVEEIKQKITLGRTSERIRYSTKDVECLARNIYWEAGVENMLGKIAVGTVTINRVKTGVWGQRVCDVVYSKHQFSWTRVARRAWINLKGSSWEDSQTAARIVLEQGVTVKQLDRALFYHADYVNPQWRDNSSKAAKIGRHIFYNQAKGNRTQL